MTTVDLDAIRARHQAFEATWDHEFCGPDGPKAAAASAEDVPALLGVVETVMALTRTDGGHDLHPTKTVTVGALREALGVAR